MTKSYNLYTDGSCLVNPGPGGIGYVIFEVSDYGEEVEVHRDYRGFHQSTNQRMELMAGVLGLKKFRDLYKNNFERLSWFTDSKYITDNVYNYSTWARGGKWETSSGEPVANVDLWKELEPVRKSLNVLPTWIPREENKVADGLAKNGAKNPTHTDFGFSSGRVGTSLNQNRHAPVLFDKNINEVIIRVYLGSQRTSKKNKYKVKFEVVDGVRKVFGDKFFAYAEYEIDSNLHRHHVYKVIIVGGEITEIIDEI